MKYSKILTHRPLRRLLYAGMVACLLFLNGCFHYGFTGASIPKGVHTVYIPFFANQSSSSISNISNKLNQALVDRFIKKSPLHLANNRSNADAVLEGSINEFSDQPFSVNGNNQASQNQVTIQVQATFQYTKKKKAEWSNKAFSGSATYNPNDNPIQGKNDAAQQALDQIANNMFNQAVSGW
ncbi:MAG TPA: LptE family protein [Balneolaceae bacterium]|nr:LptE family protein [Balneolaceae bacterium]